MPFQTVFDELMNYFRQGSVSDALALTLSDFAHILKGTVRFDWTFCCCLFFDVCFFASQFLTILYYHLACTLYNCPENYLLALTK